MSSTESSAQIGLRRFSIMAVVWLVAAYLAGQQILNLPFGFVVFSVLVFAIPIALSGAYCSAVNQARAMSYYQTSGWIYKLRSGRLLRSMAWVIWALISSFFVLLQFSTYSRWEWLTLCLAVPIFWLVHWTCNRVLASELKKRYVVVSTAIYWTRILCPICVLVVYGVLVSIFVESPSYASLHEALLATRIGTPEIAGSSVVQASMFVISLVNGGKAYLGSGLKQISEYFPIGLAVLSGWVVFFNASSTFACFVIRPVEYRRVFGPISVDDVPPPLSGRRLAMSIAIVIFVSFFLYVPMFAQLEDVIRREPVILETLNQVQIEAERIDNAYYTPGTIKLIEVEKAVALGKVNLSRSLLEGQVDRAFDQMAGNVDSYLDWYYSLTGEYSRIAKLMMGEIETYMETTLAEKLKEEESFKPIAAAIEAAFAMRQTAATEYQQSVKEILDRGRLTVAESSVKSIANIGLDDILTLPSHADEVTLKSRLASGAVATGVGAVAAKVASKGLFKAAAKALSKVAVSKATGAAVGAGVGMAAGSVIPGVGTVIGGVIGGVIAGLFVDKALLKLEEAISRESFKNEILASIGESRMKLKEGLFQTNSPVSQPVER